VCSNFYRKRKTKVDGRRGRASGKPTRSDKRGGGGVPHNAPVGRKINLCACCPFYDGDTYGFEFFE
jgi:hypothetical protein